MPLETASTIADLVSTNPVGASDTPAALDDHIRLIKTVLKADALVDADIGVAVQAYDADTAKLDVAQTWTAAQSFTVASGYGTGGGGTVTQLTSKTTAVTLNKPSGQITMYSGSGGDIAANTEISFQLNISGLAGTDCIIINSSMSNNYAARSAKPNTGYVNIYIKNITAGSLNEAIVINFAVIKGSSS